MTLEQIAQQAMDYLDSVGVAADYEIENQEFPFSVYVNVLFVYTDSKRFHQVDTLPLRIINELKRHYPISKEQQEIESRIDKIKSPN